MAVRTAHVVLTASAAQAIAENQRYAASAEQTAGRVERAGQKAGKGWDMAGKAGGRVAVAGVAALTMIEKANVTFDRSMSAVNAATMETPRNLERLRRASIKAGADTAFSATEAADGVTELAKAGVGTADILGGALRGALDLAAAGQIGVAEAAEYTATALTQFQLKGDKATHVADLLAAGAGKAQGDVSDMALALSYAGVPAAQLGISIEETAGTIALFAKNGIIGERAGTSMRGMLASLTSPSEKASKLMQRLGVDVFDAKGEFVGFDGVAGQLQDKLGGLTEEQRSYALGVIFGNEQLQAANVLLRGGEKAVDRWTKKVDDQGYAAETAGRKMDNLAGDWEKFTGELESAFIEGGGGLQGGLRDLVQGAEDLVGKFNDLPDAVQENSVKAVAKLTAAGGLIWVLAKARNTIDDLRGIRGRPGRGGAAGALGSVAGGPVPVFVTNPGFGAAGGVPGKGGSTPIVGGVGGGKQRGKVGGAVVGGAKAAGAIGAAAAVLSFGVNLVGGRDVVTELGDVKDSLDRAGEAGKGMATNVRGVRTELEQSNVGKYAKDLGIDLDKLSRDIAKNGDSGVYLNQVMRDLNNQGLKEVGAGIADFITPGWDSKIKLAGRAVEDLGSIASKTERRQKGLNGVFAGARDLVGRALPDLARYTKTLKGFPEEAITEIALKGDREARRSIVDLTAKYDLTPAEVRTLIRETGGEPTKRMVDRIIAAAEDLDRRNPKPRLDAQDNATRVIRKVGSELTGVDRRTANPDVRAQNFATGVINAVRGQLNAIDGDVATTYIKTVRIEERRSVASGTNAYTSGVGGGRRTPPGSASGSTVPKSGRGYADRYLYMLADGEEITSDQRGQATRYRRTLKAINADLPPDTIMAMLAYDGLRKAGPRIGRLATGGTVGSRLEILEAEARVRDLQSQMQSASQSTSGSRIEILEAQSRVRDLAAELKAATSKSPSGTRLEILEARQAIREINSELRARKKKRVRVGKGKFKQVDDGYETTGLKRQILVSRRREAERDLKRLRRPEATSKLDQDRLAEQLKEARAEEARLRTATPALDRGILAEQLKEAQAEVVRLKGSAAAAEQTEKRAETTERLTGTLDIFARGTSAGAVLATVTRATQDVTAYEQTVARLRGAGAAPALLKAIMEKAESGDFRSATRLGQSLLNQPLTLSRINASLGGHAAAVTSAASLTTDPRMLAGGAWSPAMASSKSLEVQIQALDVSSVSQEITRMVRHEIQALIPQLGG